MKAITGVGEWAECSYNVQTGCENRCAYCYAEAMAIRFGRATAESWPDPVAKNPPPPMPRNKLVMFPSTHDVTLDNVDQCCRAIDGLLANGNDILIVSKPSVGAITNICHLFQGMELRIEFRFTMGSWIDETLRLWEPGAPSRGNRLACMRWVKKLGFRFSVSSEPLLDADTVTLVESLRNYTPESIWLGRANRLVSCVGFNRPGDVEWKMRAVALQRTISDDYIRALYERYRNDPLIRWKDSIKKIVGLPMQAAKGA